MLGQHYPELTVPSRTDDRFGRCERHTGTLAFILMHLNFLWRVFADTACVVGDNLTYYLFVFPVPNDWGYNNFLYHTDDGAIDSLLTLHRRFDT